MDLTLIIIVIVILIGLIGLGIYLVTSTSKKKFVASDGTTLDSKVEQETYESLLKTFKVIFDPTEFANLKQNKEILGLKTAFLDKLKVSGFEDLKTLVKFKDDFIKLSELLQNQN